MLHKIKNKMLLVVVLALSPVFMTLPSGSFLSRLLAPPSSLLTSASVSVFKSVVFSQNSTFRDVMVLSALGFGFAPIAAAAPLLPVMAAAPFIKWVCLFSAVGRVAWSVDGNGKDIRATLKNTEQLKETTSQIGQKTDKIQKTVSATDDTVNDLSTRFDAHAEGTKENFATLQQNIAHNQTMVDKHFVKTATELDALKTGLKTLNIEAKQTSKEIVVVSGSVKELGQKSERANSDAKRRDDETQQKISALQKQTQNLNEGVSNLRTEFVVLNTTVMQNDQKLHGKIGNLEKKADERHQEITKKLVEKTAVMNKLLDRNQEIQDEQLAIQEQLKELSKGQEQTQEGVRYLVSHTQKQEQERANAVNKRGSSALIAFDLINKNN